MGKEKAKSVVDDQDYAAAEREMDLLHAEIDELRCRLADVEAERDEARGVALRAECRTRATELALRWGVPMPTDKEPSP